MIIAMNKVKFDLKTYKSSRDVLASAIVTR